MTVKSIPKDSNTKNLKQCYTREFNFITELLSNVDLPRPESDSSESEEEDKSKKKVRMLKNTERAKTLEELHKRLEALRDQKYTYKGKKLKNKLQSKLKRKKKVFEKHAAKGISKLETKHSLVNDTKIDVKLPKPVFNSEGNLVFSKFDFLGETSSVTDKRSNTLDKETGSRKQQLEKLQKKQSYLKRLEETGETEKAGRIKEEAAWNNMLKKAEGLKVKDDPILLKKTLTKKMSKKKSSEKKWKERTEQLEKQKESRQKKRRENIVKHNKEKKERKMKKAGKKGRYIPKPKS